MAGLEKSMHPPADLSPESSAWWWEIENSYELEPADYKLLVLACRAWDRATQARAALKKFGLTFTDKHLVVRPRPEILMERNSVALFAKLVRQMNLPVATPPNPLTVPVNHGALQQRRLNR